MTEVVKWSQRESSEASIGSRVREDFPILEAVNAKGQRLAFLDSAASSQKPRQVIEALERYYRETNANIHRGVYDLSERATAQYEAARHMVADFMNAKSAREIVFVRNTTEGINLVAQTWGRRNVAAGDLIVVTTMDHHSNLVPWQLLAEEKGARLAAVRVTDDGQLDLDHLQELLALGPRLVAFPHVSNSLGTINPAEEIIRLAHEAGAVTVVDGAQSVPHMPVDVQALDADFVAFSGHKMLGPMGSGALYGKLALLEAMPPFMGGGGMIRKVTIEGSTWADVPARFEAGTPAVGDAIGLGRGGRVSAGDRHGECAGARADADRVCACAAARGSGAAAVRTGGCGGAGGGDLVYARRHPRARRGGDSE